jgi:hypothetical protein
MPLLDSPVWLLERAYLGEKQRVPNWSSLHVGLHVTFQNFMINQH